MCQHPERAAIDAAALAGTSNRVLARQFGVGHDAVLCQKAEHLLAELVKAKQAEDVARATDLLAMATTLDRIALGLLAAARCAGDLKTAVAAYACSVSKRVHFGRLLRRGRT